MIVRRDHHEYRIVLEVHGSMSGEGVACIYAPYQPQCVYDAVNPDFEVFRHRGCSTQEMAEWAEKVITYDWDDKVWREDWEALERRQQEALAGIFVLGRTEVTGAVVAMLEEAGSTPKSLLERHHRGEWGEVSQEDWQANERALREGGRLLSVYHVRSEKIYVLMEADRSSTTIMLASED